ncbi:chymotrypsin-1 [Scaptodrosophila lebanonensis]|uniref:trypsin n=1 Tax=Drosophila lebanonensis TaxID=7225 RepID=A0A6J2U2N6_DROLE|nr:chymotrypsin-1 [Scaptodrosophila lebanonensis]
MANKLLVPALGALLYMTVSGRAGIIPPDTFILGGDEGLTEETPYSASLRVDNAHVCGASIVGSTTLLTAAHCVYRNGLIIDPSRVSVRVGSTNQYAGGSIVRVSQITPHPNYFNLQNNLAVITLSTPLTWTERIQPIELASGEDDLPEVGATIGVAGWGHTQDGTTSYKIRVLQLKLADSEVCKDAYTEQDEKSFCLAHALKEGTCYGDGGGAAVSNGKLLGVTNFVVGACGSRYPDVFVRVSRYADWLNPLLQEEN